MSPEHVDVLIVGAGLSGIGAACHLQAECPDKTLRDPRGARRDRRHLGPVPLPGHPLGLGHVHPRVRLPAVDATRRRSPTAPAIRAYIAETAREYGVEREDPLPPPGGRRRLVERGRALDGHRPAHRHRGDGAADLLVAVGLLRLLPLRRGLPADVPGRGALRRPSSSTRSTGPRTSTRPASGSSSSAAAPPPSRWCPAWPTTPST